MLSLVPFPNLKAMSFDPLAKDVAWLHMSSDLFHQRRNKTILFGTAEDH